MDNPPPLCGYFRIAREMSYNSTYRIRMGAVLVHRKPISRGYNKLKSHPIYANPEKHIKISLHAEIDCLIKAKKDVKGSDIYVYREYKNGEPAMARPCNDCIAKLKEFGIKRIFYSTPHYPFWDSEYI